MPAGNGSYVVKKSGAIFPINIRDLKHRTPLFRLDPGNGSARTYYLKIRSNTSRNIPLTIWDRDSFYAFDHEESLVSGMFFGLVLIMIVYNLFFFIFLNDVTYLYFVLSVSAYFLYLLGLKGFDYEYLFPNNPYPFRQISPVVGAFAMFWTVKFEQSFLKTKTTVPVFHIILNVLLVIEAALFCGAILIRHNIFGVVGNIITIGWIAAIISAAVAAWIKKSKDAPFVLFAHSTTFLGVMLYSLRSLGVLPSNLVTLYSHQIGFSISVVLLSIGISSNIIRIRIEKEKAQSEALEYLKKVNEMQDKFVDYLETRVEERTHALNDAYDSLKHKDSAISRDIHLAKRIQSSLLPKDHEGFAAEDCVVRYLPMIEVGGDLYDIFEMDSGIVRVFLADATGHGVQAALLTMLIKSQYESVKQFYAHPHEIFYHMNESIISNYSHLDFFFTGILLDIDFKKSLIRYVSAGHPAQILAGKKGIVEIPPSGKLIGIVPNVKFQTMEIAFTKGDRLLRFTDGLFDEFNSNGEELAYRSSGSGRRMLTVSN
jgi:serine phosphatase RsbU (regulator of sigma subunit)